MTVENVKVNLVKGDGKCKAFCSATCNGINLYSMSLVEGNEGMFIGTPVQKDKEGNYTKYHYFSFGESDKGDLLSAVMARYNELIGGQLQM
jgi:DNA-binding cell septation regulator SpoVG